MSAVSRRHLLGGLSLLPLVASGALGSPFSERRRRHAAGGGALPSISPGAGWTGVAKTGGVPAVFPGGVTTSDPITRTTAKPAIHWLVPSDLRLVGSRVIGVDADAKGGLSGVVFHLEGNEVTVAAPSLYTDTDANGASRTRWGYWINVVTAATSGEARLFATAVPNDGTMQNRVIGFDNPAGDPTGNWNGNYPMNVFPRLAVNDGTYNVTPSGGAYTSILAAITQARTDSKEAPLILLKETTNYELVNSALSPSNYASGKGFCTIAADTGITATLGRAAAYSPSGNNSWTPGWDGIEFRGSGIVFDQRNWTTMSFTTKGAWFNGCKFTNSIGTRDSYYWNGSTHPGFGTVIESYWDNVYVEWISQGSVGLQAQRYAQGCSIKQACGDMFSGTHYVAGNYLRGWDGNFFQPVVTSINITYTNPGGHTTATVSGTGNGGSSGTLILKVDGATVTTIPLGFYSSDTNPTIQSAVNAINAFGNGWSATMVGTRGLMTAAALGGENGPQTLSGSAFNTALALVSAIGIHGDWWQGYSGAHIRENVIIRNNVCRADNVADSNSFLFNDDADHAGNGSSSYDHIVKGNIWTGTAPNNYFSGAYMSHYVFENNTAPQMLCIRYEYVNGVVAQGSNPGDQVYSSYKNNIVTMTVSGYSGSGTHYPYSSPWVNNIYAEQGGYTADGPNDSGNVLFTAASYASLFVDYANGDFRPAASGTLISNPMPKVNGYDGTGVAYSTSDVAGARSLNASAPAYAF